MASSARNKRGTAPAQAAAAEWSCQRCGRQGTEVLAAHRVDAIRVAMRGIGGHSEVSRREIRPYLRKIAKRLRAPYLALLECVDQDIVASDVSGLPTTRCTAAPNVDCVNEAADGAATVQSVRAQAAVEAIAVFLDEVDDGYEYDGLNDYRELAEAMQLPGLVLDVLLSRVVGGTFELADVDEFNAWRAAEPVAAMLLVDEVA